MLFFLFTFKPDFFSINSILTADTKSLWLLILIFFSLLSFLSFTHKNQEENASPEHYMTNAQLEPIESTVKMILKSENFPLTFYYRQKELVSVKESVGKGKNFLSWFSYTTNVKMWKLTQMQMLLCVRRTERKWTARGFSSLYIKKKKEMKFSLQSFVLSPKEF